jgi:hypothetical protein
MNHTTKETESGAIREIEPEIRTLFSKVVERDPREAAKMLEPYPDEFVVGMLNCSIPSQRLTYLNASIRRWRDGAIGPQEIRGRSSYGVKYRRNNVHRRWLPARLPRACCLADLNTDN